MVSAVICAGIYPHVARVIRPPKRFIEVSGGSIEKELEPSEFTYYIPFRPDQETQEIDSSTLMNASNGSGDTRPMQKVSLSASTPMYTASCYNSRCASALRASTRPHLSSMPSKPSLS